MSSTGAPIGIKIIGSKVSEAEGVEAIAMDTAVTVTLQINEQMNFCKEKCTVYIFVEWNGRRLIRDLFDIPDSYIVTHIKGNIIHLSNKHRRNPVE